MRSDPECTVDGDVRRGPAVSSASDSASVASGSSASGSSAPASSPAVLAALEALEDEDVALDLYSAGLLAIRSVAWQEALAALAANDVAKVQALAHDQEVQRALEMWRNTAGETIVIVLSRNGSAALLRAVLEPLPVARRHEVLNDVPERARGMLPLHLAALSGHVDCVRVAVSFGASPRRLDAYGLSPLHRAAAGGHADVCRELLLSGADLLALDKAGMTAWHRACLHGRLETCLAFLEHSQKHGLDAELVAHDAIRSSGKSSLHLLAHFSAPHAVTEALVEVLVHRVGIDVDQRARSGLTALHEAAVTGNAGVAAVLLRFGAGVNLATLEEKSTALHLAITNFQVDVCRQLLTDGAVDLAAMDAAGRTARALAEDDTKFGIVRLFDDSVLAALRDKNRLELERLRPAPLPRKRSIFDSFFASSVTVT